MLGMVAYAVFLLYRRVTEERREARAQEFRDKQARAKAKRSINSSKSQIPAAYTLNPLDHGGRMPRIDANGYPVRPPRPESLSPSLRRFIDANSPIPGRPESPPTVAVERPQSVIAELEDEESIARAQGLAALEGKPF